ncbi:hypothetical protein MTO96_036721 [Rhipicephalus appendiculatus]
MLSAHQKQLKEIVESFALSRERIFFLQGRSGWRPHSAHSYDPGPWPHSGGGGAHVELQPPSEEPFTAPETFALGPVCRKHSAAGPQGFTSVPAPPLHAGSINFRLQDACSVRRRPMPRRDPDFFYGPTQTAQPLDRTQELPRVSTNLRIRV